MVDTIRCCFTHARGLALAGLLAACASSKGGGNVDASVGTPDAQAASIDAAMADAPPSLPPDARPPDAGPLGLIWDQGNWDLASWQ